RSPEVSWTCRGSRNGSGRRSSPRSPGRGHERAGAGREPDALQRPAPVHGDRCRRGRGGRGARRTVRPGRPGARRLRARVPFPGPRGGQGHPRRPARVRPRDRDGTVAPQEVLPKASGKHEVRRLELNRLDRGREDPPESSRRRSRACRDPAGVSAHWWWGAGNTPDGKRPPEVELGKMGVVPKDATPADAPSNVPDTPIPSRAAGERVLDLLRVMHRLRGPDGCPWGLEQTHASLGRHLLEGAHETLEAIDAGDPDRLRDELGDLLLQVVFHSEMARQEG